MKFRLFLAALVAAVLCPAAETGPATGQAGNKALQVQATLYIDKEEIQALLGQELEKGVVVVKVELTPKGEEPLQFWHDHFFLRSDKDGQRSGPFDPAELASSSVITLVRTWETGPVMSQPNGPVWGPVGGGQPSRLPGSGGGIGNATTGIEGTEATVNDGNASGPKKENKLLDSLKEKTVPEGDLTKPVSGLLYFPMDGKHKVKQIELHYRGPAGSLDLRFKRPDK